MITQQALLHVWRPEAADFDPEFPERVDPFDGIETYLARSEQEASELANRLADEHPTWKFHVDMATPWGS